jgi:hypothetical protein
MVGHSTFNQNFQIKMGGGIQQQNMLVFKSLVIIFFIKLCQGIYFNFLQLKIQDKMTTLITAIILLKSCQCCPFVPKTTFLDPGGFLNLTKIIGCPHKTTAIFLNYTVSIRIPHLTVSIIKVLG